MAPHSSTLAWKIPWMEEAGRLQSMGLLRVRHDWATSLSLFTSIGEGNGTHSSVLAWRIPGTGESGGLPSVGPHRVGHDWSDLAAAAAAAASPLPDQDPILVAFSFSLLISFNLDEFLHLDFMILMFSKIAGQLLCRISFSLDFLMFLYG